MHVTCPGVCAVECLVQAAARPLCSSGAAYLHTVSVQLPCSSPYRISCSAAQAKGGSFSKDKDFYRFTLGRGEVIPAFEEAVMSMREGGIRRIVVPVELGYPDNNMNALGPSPTTFSVRALQRRARVLPAWAPEARSALVLTGQTGACMRHACAWLRSLQRPALVALTDMTLLP